MVGDSGWYELLDILKSVRAEAELEEARGPIACPRCGEPLRLGPGGVRHCQYDGYTYA